MRVIAILCCCLGLLLGPSAFAHSMPNTVIILGESEDGIRGEATLPWNELSYALPSEFASAPLALDNRTIELLVGYLKSHIGGSDPHGGRWSVDIVDLALERSIDHVDLHVSFQLTPPRTSASKHVLLRWDAITHIVMSHVVLIFKQHPSQEGGLTLVGALQNPSRELNIAANEQTFMSFASAFFLGMGHLAGGLDHILFLLTLILPVPLLRNSGGQSAGRKSTNQSLLDLLFVTTAFTIGHSLTLAIGVMGGWAVAQQPVEIGITFSILVAAVAAWKPLPLGYWTAPAIAAIFGLIHGMSFAAVLNEIHLDHWNKIVAVVAFNLGIETMQALVLVVAVPLVVALARTRAYTPVRVGGAAFSACAAMLWLGLGIAA